MWSQVVVVYDRDAVVAATDLVALADELLGMHQGSDRAPKWSCPNPEHPQTGRTPPVSVFSTRWGEQRWRCHGCGNGGSVIDLVMQVHGLTAREALAGLARRAGIPPLPAGGRPRRGRPRAEPANRSPAPIPLVAQPIPALDHYVSECSALLWTAAGTPVRRWLTETRRIPEDVLQANRIGVDLGATRQPRPSGIPPVRTAVVLPVLTDDRRACYVQLRTLHAHPHFPKYLSPRSSLAPNPRVGIYRPGQQNDAPFEHREMIVTEGIMDALAANAAGYTAAAVLGAGYPDPTTAILLTRHTAPLVVAFDPDPAGRAGSDELCRHLRTRRRNPSVLKLQDGDLNDHLIRSAEWPLELAARVQHATHRRPPSLGHALARSGLTWK